MTGNIEYSPVFLHQSSSYEERGVQSQKFQNETAILPPPAVMGSRLTLNCACLRQTHPTSQPRLLIGIQGTRCSVPGGPITHTLSRYQIVIFAFLSSFLLFSFFSSLLACIRTGYIPAKGANNPDRQGSISNPASVSDWYQSQGTPGTTNLV